MITRSVYHTNTVRLGLNGFLDLGQRILSMVNVFRAAGS